MAPGCYYHARMLKRKRIVVDEERETMLNVRIRYAEGIDAETTRGRKGIYQVVGWVVPGKEFCTAPAEGFLSDPEWHEEYRIPLGPPTTSTCSSSTSRYLSLEVVRVKPRSDPGTSTGIALVGRVRIPLPKDTDVRTTNRWGLVAPGGDGCVVRGYIVVTMETKRMQADMSCYRY